MPKHLRFSEIVEDVHVQFKIDRQSSYGKLRMRENEILCGVAISSQTSMVRLILILKVSFFINFEKQNTFKIKSLWFEILDPRIYLYMEKVQSSTIANDSYQILIIIFYYHVYVLIIACIRSDKKKENIFLF